MVDYFFFSKDWLLYNMSHSLSGKLSFDLILQVTLNLDAYTTNGIVSYFPLFGIEPPNPMPSPNKGNKCNYVSEFLLNRHLTSGSEFTNFMKGTWMMEILLIDSTLKCYLETCPVPLLDPRVVQYSVMLLNFRYLTKP